MEKEKIKAEEFKPLKLLQRHLKMLQDIVKDKTWASDGSDYHKDCRKRIKSEIEQYKKAVEIMTNSLTPKE